MSDDKNDDFEKIQKELNEIKEKEKKLKNELRIAKENENIKKYEKFKDSNDLNKQVKILDEIEDDLKIPKEKNVKNIDNIISKKTIPKREKSVNDSDDDDDDDDNNNNNNNNNNKIKPKFKKYKVDYSELNQSVIGKNAITFLGKKHQKIAQEYLSKFAGNDNLYIHQNIYEVFAW
jgi:seryl-tRNA synthetase